METFYVIYSNPLRTVEEIEIGGVYCTETGHIVKLLQYDPVLLIEEYDILQISELVEGEKITELNDKLLKLFWTLMRNNSNKSIRYEKNSNKDI